MNTKEKKFISPEAWFSLNYPHDWFEFEDTEDTFLFYNPDKWFGNFRVSAYKADIKLQDAMAYGTNAAKEELKNNSSAGLVKIDAWECAYSKETFQEEGVWYTSHIWIMGMGNVAFECSFTVQKGGDAKVAEEIISTLEIRANDKCYPLEIIPIRILEIGMVNEAFEWASSTVKKQLKKDFTSSAEDIAKLQQLIDSGCFDVKQRDAWYSFSVAFGTILVNEMDGMEWVTVIDGNRELPALRFLETEVIVYPQQLIWEKIKNDQRCDLQCEFEKIKKEVETVLCE